MKGRVSFPAFIATPDRGYIPVQDATVADVKWAIADTDSISDKRSLHNALAWVKERERRERPQHGAHSPELKS